MGGKEDAERKAKEEAECKVKEDVVRKAREEAERKAREEAVRKAKKDAEHKASEEAWNPRHADPSVRAGPAYARRKRQWVPVLNVSDESTERLMKAYEKDAER